jgi:prepilin-type N-terminal cleavage/methylation domain-containing protein
MRRHHGFTLIEVVVASSITTILLTACVSVVILAGKAIPNHNDNWSCEMNAAQAADRMAGELEVSLLVLESTPTSLTITVPPRNSDVYPEKIRYSWAGTSGAPLLRQYNGGTPVAIISAVDQFNLTPVVATTTESYPGIGVEDAAQSQLLSYNQFFFLGNQNVNATSWVGQYFASNSWAAGVVGWRPTQVTYYAKQNNSSGVCNLQMYLAGQNLTPIGSSIEQYSLSGSALNPFLYGTENVTYSHIGRLAPATGACFVVQGTGTNSVTIENNISPAGMLQTGNAGSAWSYQSGNALQSTLYGKLTRSSTTQYVTTTYMSAMQILLRAGPATNQSVQTTAQTLNHPGLFSGYWEAKFNTDPTKLDVNGDGIMDWTVHGGGTFNTANLVSGAWQANGVQLDSQPANNFTNHTVVDLRLCATSAGSWAGFNINAARSGSTCAPILGQLTLQSDGTQSLTVWRKLNDATPDGLLTITGLPNQPVDLHLIIDPSFGTAGIRVNNVEYGSFAYNTFTSSDTSACLSLMSSGSAQFSYARVQEMQY